MHALVQAMYVHFILPLHWPDPNLLCEIALLTTLRRFLQSVISHHMLYIVKIIMLSPVM